MNHDDVVDLDSVLFTHEWAIRQKAPTKATPTQFPSLNRVLGDDGGRVGIPHESGFFVTIGGGTGQGKSLLAQNMAVHAMLQGRKIGFLSLEMSRFMLAARFHAMATGVPVHDLERGNFSMAAFDQVFGAVCDRTGSANKGNFYVNTKRLRTLESVMEMSRFMRGEYGVDWLVLDYMQLCSTGDEESIYRTVTTVGGEMLDFAQEEEICVLALSQFNTPQGKDTSQPPTMYGLMGGATIPQNGNLVLLLDHSRYERHAMHRHIARTFIIIDKNRSGDH